MQTPSMSKAAFKAAFPHTLPIMAGFLFLGFTYGLYMHSLGFGFLYPTLMALCIYGGSLEFVAASMLLSIAGGTVFYMILLRVIPLL